MALISEQVSDWVYDASRIVLKFSKLFSGPKRYDYSEDNDTWLYSRDSRSLGELLNEELSKIFGFPVELGITKVNNLL